MKYLNLEIQDEVIEQLNKTFPGMNGLLEGKLAILREYLDNHECEIYFTKVDGTRRQMRCTRMPSLLPEKTEGSEGRNYPADVVPVFDLDKQEWRSFRVDSLISITVDGQQFISEEYNGI